MSEEKLSSAQSAFLREVQKRVEEMSQTNLLTPGADIPALLLTRREAVKIASDKLRAEFPEAAKASNGHIIASFPSPPAPLSPMDGAMSQLFFALHILFTSNTLFGMGSYMGTMNSVIHEACVFSDEYSALDYCWKDEMEEDEDDFQ